VSRCGTKPVLSSRSQAAYNALSQVTVKATVGVGIGVKAGGHTGGDSAGVRVEAAVKANLKFSGGSLTLSSSVEGGASAAVGNKQYGLAGSAEKNAATLDLGSNQLSASHQPAAGEWVAFGHSSNNSVEGSNGGFSVGGEEGEGALAGGSFNITSEGVGDANSGVGEILNSLASFFKPEPPPPQTPAPPQTPK